jgi:hypothetical protein
MVGETRQLAASRCMRGNLACRHRVDGCAFAETDDYARDLSPVAQRPHQKPHRGVNLPSAADEVDNPKRGGELTEELDHSVDDDLEI